MVERKLYVPTDPEATHVAGQRIRDRSRPLLLTDRQADHPLRIGQIKPFVDLGPKKPAKIGKDGAD